MFDNSGDKLRNYATVLFVASIIAVLILSALVSYDAYTEEFKFFRFIAISVVGGVASYISCLILSAFGDLVSDTQQTRENTRELIRLNEKLIRSQKEDAHTSADVPTAPAVSSPAKAPSVEFATIPTTATGTLDTKSLLEKSLTFSTDERCQIYLQSNFQNLTDYGQKELAPLVKYIFMSDATGLKIAVESFLKNM